MQPPANHVTMALACGKQDGEVRLRQALPLHGATAPLIRAMAQHMWDRSLAYAALGRAVEGVTADATKGEVFGAAELRAAVAAALDYSSLDAEEK